MLSDFYEIGYELVMYEWDTSTQTPQKMVVDSIDDATWTLRVTFDSAPTFTGTRYISFSASDEPGLSVTTQRDYAFFAADTGRVDFDTELEPAKEYSA